MKPRAPVSVVVPTYNGAGFIACTLRSIAGQTVAPLEIIVVDDGSTDATLEVVGRCGVDVTILRKRNGGVSSTRNAGLAAASGEFICFVDQDDHWYPQHLERQWRAFGEQPHAGVVVSPYQHWYPGARGYPDPGQVLPPQPATDVDPAFSGWVYHRFLLDCWALTSATMIRRDLLVAQGAFDTALPYSEDWDLWLRLARAVQFRKLNWPPVLYRQHAAQGTRTVRAIDWRSELLIRNAREYGLASRDGRRVPPGLFARTLARFQAEFGGLHIAQGDLRTGCSAMAAALRRDPGSAGRFLSMSAGATLERLGARRRKALGDARQTSHKTTSTP